MTASIELPEGAEPEVEPERKSSRRRFPAWARMLVVMAVMLLLAEGWARSIEGQLPPPPDPKNTEVGYKLGQMRAMRDGARTVFMGDSMMDAGLDPAVVAETGLVPGTLYNGSMMGARSPIQVKWVKEFVIPELRPTLVVHAISPNLVSTLGLTPDEQALFDAVRGSNVDVLRDDVWQNMDDWFSSWSHLVRNRASLRNPRFVGQATFARMTSNELFPEFFTRPPGFWNDNVSPSGHVITFEGGRADPTGPPSLLALVKTLIESDYNVTNVESILDLYARSGVAVVVVIPPAALDILANNGLDVGKWQKLAQVVRDAAQRRGLPLIDFTDSGYTQELFFDVFHLNGAGSQRFSRELAQRLAEVCKSRPSLACT